MTTCRQSRDEKQDRGIIKNRGLPARPAVVKQPRNWAMSTYTHGRVRDSVMANRYRFLWAVQELVPEVLEALEHTVFPCFKALHREEPSGEPGESGTAIWGNSGASVATFWITWPSLRMRPTEAKSGWPSWALDVIGAPLNSERLKLKDAMERWARNYHLCSEAIQEDAFNTLCFWLVSPRVNRIWFPRGYSRTGDENTNVPKLHIDDEWNFQSWSIVNKRLQEQISVYKSDIKKYCERIGFDLDRMRGNRAHHQWLALYQCRGMSPAKIRDWEEKNNQRKVDLSAVSHAMETLTKKIGLERRPNRRGHRRSR
jgi:hypothetical protein